MVVEVGDLAVAAIGTDLIRVVLEVKQWKRCGAKLNTGGLLANSLSLSSGLYTPKDFTGTRARLR